MRHQRRPDRRRAFRIDGTIEGSVESHASVVVGESGVVRGGVRGTDVVIAGTVQGDVICAGHLEILAKGKVEGDIAAQEHAHRDRRRVLRNQPHGRHAVADETSAGAIPVSADLSSAA